jgi:hypothetical protein
LEGIVLRPLASNMKVERINFCSPPITLLKSFVFLTNGHSVKLPSLLLKTSLSMNKCFILKLQNKIYSLNIFQFETRVLAREGNFFNLTLCMYFWTVKTLSPSTRNCLFLGPVTHGFKDPLSQDLFEGSRNETTCGQRRRARGPSGGARDEAGKKGNCSNLVLPLISSSWTSSGTLTTLIPASTRLNVSRGFMAALEEYVWLVVVGAFVALGFGCGTGRLQLRCAPLGWKLNSRCWVHWQLSSDCGARMSTRPCTFLIPHACMGC